MLSLMLPNCNANQSRISSPNPGPSPETPTIAFGKEAWEDYFGAVGEGPALPDHIEEILDSDCPFWPGKKVKETHLLVLIPTHVNGTSFTLDLLKELVESPKQGHSTRFSLDYSEGTIQKIFEAKGPRKHAYWALMTRDLLPGSRGKTYRDQQALLQQYTGTGANYRLPSVLEASTVILSHYVRSKERCYTRTYTYCEEKIDNTKPVCVGGFSDKNRSLTIYYNRGSLTCPCDEGIALIQRL
jgi:hypothetical protein